MRLTHANLLVVQEAPGNTTGTVGEEAELACRVGWGQRWPRQTSPMECIGLHRISKKLWSKTRSGWVFETQLKSLLCGEKKITSAKLRVELVVGE